MELENIRVRVTESIKKRKRDGKSPGGKYVSLGYRRLTDEKGESYLAINDKEAKIIRNIYDSYISGMNVIEIARDLNEKNYKTRTNSKFVESSIIRILKNPIYIGKIKLYETDENKRSKRLKLIDGLHKPIISIDIWNNVQAMMNENKIVKRNHENYLFSGKIICYKCGAKMYGVWSGSGKNKRLYYRCHNSYRVKSCNSAAIRVDVVDNILIESLTLLINSSMFMESLNANLVKEVQRYRTKNLNIDTLQVELQSLEKRRQYLTEQFQSGIIEETMFVNSKKLFTERFNYLLNQLKSINNSDYLLNQKTITLIKKDVDIFVNKLSMILHNSKNNIEYKSEVINELVEFIQLDKTGEPRFNIQITQNLFNKMLNNGKNDMYDNLAFTFIINKKK